MTITIKSRNFSPNKTERTYDEAGFGWAPGQEKKFEGTGINSIKYSKGHALAFGTCKKCKHFNKKEHKVGEHCNLPSKEPCVK